MCSDCLFNQESEDEGVSLLFSVIECLTFLWTLDDYQKTVGWLDHLDYEFV